MNIVRLRKSVSSHEGIRYEAYKDTKGLWTTAIGHLIRHDEKHLITKKLTNADVDVIFTTDLNVAIDDARKFITESDINEEAFEVICELSFWLGLPKLLMFKNLREALRQKDYDTAANELLDSKLGRSETKGIVKRINELSERMRSS
tara:strand:+ start:71 stop:511 length:441 start_codon:yes stop_codon:yes gene_type:complete